MSIFMKPEHRPTRCVDGRLMRHDPQLDDPYLETDRGPCPECDGKGCPRCAHCDALVDDDGYSIDERCCFYCKED